MAVLPEAIIFREMETVQVAENGNIPYSITFFEAFDVSNEDSSAADLNSMQGTAEVSVNGNGTGSGTTSERFVRFSEMSVW